MEPPSQKLVDAKSFGDRLSTILFFLCKRLLLLPLELAMLRGSVIDDILGDTCHKINIPFFDTNEDRRSKTIILSSASLSFLNSSRCRIFERIGEKF
jgi:hypothetical protein